MGNIFIAIKIHFAFTRHSYLKECFFFHKINIYFFRKLEVNLEGVESNYVLYKKYLNTIQNIDL